MSFPIILTGGQVTVNKSPMTAVDLVCAGWGTHDEGFVQLALGADMVGSNIRMLGEFDWPQPKTPVTTTRSFPLFVVSECDQNGDPFDPFEGAWSNLAYLREHVFDQPAVADRPDGTREVTLTLPTGDEYEAHCQFRVRIQEPTASGWYLLVDVDIVEGSFQPVEPVS
jgi:hypothetical protein